MANLSASRRNSAVSTVGSYPNSPRPSISSFNQFISSSPQPMQSLNEEDDVVKTEVKEIRTHLSVNSFNAPKKSHQCSERSDSGFSECSNCSGSVIACCDKDDKVRDLSIAISHDILKTKLEEIAKSQSKINELEINEYDETEANLRDEKVEDLPLKKTESPPTLIEKSESSNSIHMRKKSLENSIRKEKPKAKPIVTFEQPGKVSLLKSKFASNVEPEKVLKSERPVSKEKGLKIKAASNVFDRLSSVNSSNIFLKY